MLLNISVLCFSGVRNSPLQQAARSSVTAQ